METPNLRTIAKRFIKLKPNPEQDIELEGVEGEVIIIDPTDTICLFGSKSCGKSYLLSALADQMPKAIIWDIHYERTTKNDKTSFSVKAHKMPDKWLAVNSIQGLEKAILQKKNHIIYHPAPLSKERSHEDMVNEFDAVCEQIWNYGNFTFFIDELDAVNDNYHITPFFHNLMEYSKHKNIGIIAATRRLQHINPRVPRLSDTLIIFRVSGKDAKYIFEFLIEPEEEASKSQFFNNLKKQLTHLPDREFFYFDGKDLKQYGAIDYEL